MAEDSRKGVAFVTERIVCSLADLLSRFEQIPGRYNWHSNYLEPNATITGKVDVLLYAYTLDSHIWFGLKFIIVFCILSL